MSENDQRSYRYDVETGIHQDGTYSTETKTYQPGITNPSIPFYIIEHKITDDTYDQSGNILIPGGKEKEVKTPVTLIETENSKKARYLYELEPQGPKFRRIT